jgi:hypothetical protein
MTERFKILAFTAFLWLLLFGLFVVVCLFPVETTIVAIVSISIFGCFGVVAALFEKDM